jgi:hypothetical protein
MMTIMPHMIYCGGKMMTKISIEDIVHIPLLEKDQKGDKVLTIYDCLLKIKQTLDNAS